MKKISLFILTAVLVVFTSCSKDEESFNLNSLTLTTKAPVLGDYPLSFMSGGNFSKDLPSNGNYTLGICFSENPNPTINDQVASVYNFFDKSFTTLVEFEDFDVTYYIRAFIVEGNTDTVIYGNEVTYTIPVAMTTGIVRNISAEDFTVDVTVFNILEGNSERGICFSTSSNPTISNYTILNPTAGTGSFTLNVSLFGGYYGSNYYNKVYYLRSFVKIQDKVFYGNEVSFRTAGYIGGSGGYVFFDKGSMSNGWRYLEASQAKLLDPNSTNFIWSNTNSFLPNISNEIGKGYENSVTIRNDDNNYTNVAAALALYNVTNNVNDWFLPSINELKELYKIRKINLINSAASGPNSYYNKNVCSSSQLSADICLGINFDNGQQVNLAKTSQLHSGWQVRRF